MRVSRRVGAMLLNVNNVQKEASK